MQASLDLIEGRLANAVQTNAATATNSGYDSHRDSFGGLEGVMVQIGNAIEMLTAGQGQGNFEKLLEVITKNQNVRSPKPMPLPVCLITATVSLPSRSAL